MGAYSRVSSSSPLEAYQPQVAVPAVGFVPIAAPYPTGPADASREAASGLVFSLAADQPAYAPAPHFNDPLSGFVQCCNSLCLCYFLFWVEAN